MAWWMYLGLLIIIYKLLDRLVRIPKSSSPSSQKDHILVTGCDTGFGNLFAKRLASKGFHVYAGCLTATGKQKLEQEAPACLKALLLDVTRSDSVRAAYADVSKALPSGKGKRRLQISLRVNITNTSKPVTSMFIKPAHLHVKREIRMRFNVIHAFLETEISYLA